MANQRLQDIYREQTLCMTDEPDDDDELDPHRWDFIPADWPKIENQQEYEACRPILTGFEQAISFAVHGALVDRLRISADGLRFRMRDWELRDY